MEVSDGLSQRLEEFGFVRHALVGRFDGNHRNQSVGLSGSAHRAKPTCSTPRCNSGRSARISDGNHDGNDGSRQRTDAAVNSHVLSHIRPELGIRYT